MKKILSLLFINSVATVTFSQASFIITPGSFVKSANGINLVFNNTMVKNEGSIEQASGDGLIKFTGTGGAGISGTGTTTFNSLEIDGGFNLQSNISIVNNLVFRNGLLNLNDFILKLGTTGRLVNENERSRAFTNGNGYIEAIANLSAPNAANPGNLGAVITSPENLGVTVIRRGHKIQNNISGNNNSIRRYYDIVPTNNLALKATLRYHYLDAELNGNAEISLHQWKHKDDKIHWDLVGADLVNTSSNFVERKTIAKFSRWTLAKAEAPVIFCPSNLTVSSNLAGCKASVDLLGSSGATAIGTPQPTIAYSIAGVSISSPHVFAKGTTTVTATASNGFSSNAVCSFKVSVVCEEATNRVSNEALQLVGNNPAGLKSSLSPNPSVSFFNLNTTSATNDPIFIRVIDVSGREVEIFSNIQNNSTLKFGHKYSRGLYFIEVVQGKEKILLKAVKL